MNKFDQASHKMERAFTHFAKLLKTNNFALVGGVFSSFYNKKIIRDFDLFFRDLKSFELAKKSLEDHGFRENGERKAQGRSNSVIMEKDLETPVDLILLEDIPNGRLGEVLVDSSDFTIGSVAYDKDGLVYHDKYIEDLTNKKLRTLSNFQGRKKTSKRRIKKLYEKGFTFINEEMKKLHPMTEEAKEIA